LVLGDIYQRIGKFENCLVRQKGETGIDPAESFEESLKKSTMECS
jgi:hypothetical protein